MSSHSKDGSSLKDVFTDSVQSSALIRRPRSSPWPAISVDDALNLLEKYFTCGRTHVIPSSAAREGDVLAENICATKPHPEVRTSVMDGYAVIASDGPGLRSVVQKTTPGTFAPFCLQPNTVCRVNTGSMVPDGADAVVQIEDTRLVKHDNVEELVVEILSTAKPGQHIRQIGCDIAVGDVLLEKHCVLSSAELGILAGSERKVISIFERPTVAVMSTGNELIDCNANELAFGMIRDTNRPQLLSLFQSSGFNILDMGIVPDNEDRMAAVLNDAFSLSDFVVSSGGVSMGEKDLMKSILQDKFKFTIHFGRVMMKPGLPTTFASGIRKNLKKAIFALPGNPVSAWVTALLFVVPFLRKAAGRTRYNHTIIKVKVTERIALDRRPEYRRAHFRVGTGQVPEAVCTSNNQLSSRLLSTYGANLLLKLPAKSEERPFIEEGDIIDALIVGSL